MERLYFSFLEKFSLFRKKGKKKEFDTEKERSAKSGSKDHRAQIKIRRGKGRG